MYLFNEPLANTFLREISDPRIGVCGIVVRLIVERSGIGVRCRVVRRILRRWRILQWLLLRRIPLHWWVLLWWLVGWWWGHDWVATTFDVVIARISSGDHV